MKDGEGDDNAKTADQGRNDTKLSSWPWKTFVPFYLYLLYRTTASLFILGMVLHWQFGYPHKKHQAGRSKWCHLISESMSYGIRPRFEE